MEEYELILERPKRTIGELFEFILLNAGIYFIVSMFVDFFSPRWHRFSSGIWFAIILEGIQSLIWGAFMTAFFSLSAKPVRMNFTLTEESLQVGTAPLHKIRQYPVNRSVHKGQIRSIVDVSSFFRWPGGIIISEQSRWGKLFVGGSVFIPKNLPEFDRIRQLAESWRKP